MNVTNKILNITTVFFSMLVASCTGQPSNHMDQHKAEVSNEMESNRIQFGENIYAMFEDSRGDLWFGTEIGVAKYDGQRLTYLTEKDGLCGKTVANITEDQSGHIWFGTHSNMCIYNPMDNKFINFPMSGDLPTLGHGWKRVNTFSDGNLWVSTHRGTYQYDSTIDIKSENSFKEFKTPIIEKSESAFCNTPGLISLDFIDSKGNMWFGTDGHGVFRFDGSEYVQLTTEDGLLSNNVTSIIEDHEGLMWFACIKSLNSDIQDGGLCRYNPKLEGKQAFATFKDLDGLHNNNIFTMYKDKSEDIWVGATGVGVYKIDHNLASNKDNKDLKQAFQLYKEPLGVDTEVTFHIIGLMSMMEDRNGRHWFGYAGGLYFLKAGEIVSVSSDPDWNY